MAIRQILEVPDPRLKTVSEPVTEFNDELNELVADMFETMYAAPGIGLAAIQVGIPKRVLVIDLQPEDATVVKSGRRAYLNQDFISVYGGGVWTWDFDYLADDQFICQKLLHLINPVTADGNSAATSTTIASNPIVNDLSKGAGGSFDTTADILIAAPIIPASGGIEDEDRLMQSAVLQNLTIACDVGTDGGRPHMTGQFMTGFKPTISDSGISLVAGIAGDEWDYSIFDLTTITVCGVTSILKSFSITIDNPATRVGWQGTSAECDGYVRGGIINVTGSATVKLDTTTANLLDNYITGGAIGSPIDKVTYVVLLENSASWSLSFPSVLITGYSQDQAVDGIFVTIDFIATGGSTGALTSLAVIKMT